MAGISSRAVSAGGNDASCGCGNKRGFNGNEIQNKEFRDASGLEVYDFNARTYDQQIGRFIQTDPETEVNQENFSPYHFGFNNPILHDDPDGRNPWVIRGGRSLLWVVKWVQRQGTPSAASRMPIALRDATVARSLVPLTLKSQSNEETAKDKLKGEIKSLEKSVKSLEKNVKEHEQKLDDYKKDPDKYDNNGELKNVSQELRKQKIDGRIKSLEKQINKNKGELEKANQQLQQFLKKLENLNP